MIWWLLVPLFTGLFFCLLIVVNQLVTQKRHWSILPFFRSLGWFEPLQQLRFWVIVSLCLSLTTTCVVASIITEKNYIIQGIFIFFVSTVLLMLVVKHAKNKYARQIQKELPMVINLLVLSLEANLTVVHALEQVLVSVSTYKFRVFYELALAHRLILNTSINDRKIISKKIHQFNPEIQFFVHCLVDIKFVGHAKIMETLRKQSQIISHKYAIYIETYNEAAATKITMLTTLFFFPAFVIMILYPAVTKILTAISGM